MASLRILFVDQAGPLREALARALSIGGHSVRVVESAEEAANDFGPEVVVYGEGIAAPPGMAGPVPISLRRPVNMEELRRVLNSV